MKIKDLLDYILDNRISFFRYEKEINSEETYGATISINLKGELAFGSYLLPTHSKLGIDGFIKQSLTNTTRVLSDENFNVEVETVDDTNVLVTLTEIKMDNQNIRHELLHKLPMQIIKIKSLGEMLLEDFKDKI